MLACPMISCSIHDGLRREVREETGLDVEPLTLTGVYKNVTRGIVALVFRCKVTGGHLTTNDEVTAFRWSGQTDVSSLMAEAYAVRVCALIRIRRPGLRAAAVVGLHPIRDNAAVAADYDGTDEFRGASFTGADFTGANFRDCDLRQAKITDSWLVDVRMSGLVENFVVNDVDVTAFVEGELDKRHPERVQLRKMRTADDYRAMWDTLERLWAETVVRAQRLPEPTLNQRVDDEWSFVETLRHLVMATDRWAGYMILNKPMPNHPLGLPQPGFTPADAAALGIDLDVRPPLAEVLEARGTRMALVRGIVNGLSDDDLERVCPRLPAPGYPEEARSVGLCLGVVMKEECEHRRYAVRDLAALEADSAAGAAHRDAPP